MEEALTNTIYANSFSKVEVSKFYYIALSH